MTFRKKILLDYPERKFVPYKVGKFLGAGVYGAVFNVLKHPDKIIKFSSCLSKDHAQELKKVFTKLKKIKSKYISKLYDFDFVKVSTGRYFFYYVAEKLLPLEHEAIYFVNNFDFTPHKKYLESLSLEHNDIHDNNVMKNKRGQIKIIDLDSFEFYN